MTTTAVAVVAAAGVMTITTAASVIRDPMTASVLRDPMTVSVLRDPMNATVLPPVMTATVLRGTMTATVLPPATTVTALPVMTATALRGIGRPSVMIGTVLPRRTATTGPRATTGGAMNRISIFFCCYFAPKRSLILFCCGVADRILRTHRLHPSHHRRIQQRPLVARRLGGAPAA
jgi:hypothetical protein